MIVCLRAARYDDTRAIVAFGDCIDGLRDASRDGDARSRAHDDRLARALNDDGAGALPALRRDQGEPHRYIRRRGPEARDRGEDRQVPADTGKDGTYLRLVVLVLLPHVLLRVDQEEAGL